MHKPRSEEIDLLKVKKLRFQRFHVELAGYALIPASLESPKRIGRIQSAVKPQPAVRSKTIFLTKFRSWILLRFLKHLESMFYSCALIPESKMKSHEA
jgi:hypothetical protein